MFSRFLVYYVQIESGMYDSLEQFEEGFIS